VPARNVSLPAELSGLGGRQAGQLRHVPPHPNIVEILTVFADQVPGLPGDRQLYGDALPARLNPGGYGRNMSLFLVMRRYDCSLRDYLRQYGDQLSPRTSLILFTQLLEGRILVAASIVLLYWPSSTYLLAYSFPGVPTYLLILIFL